MISAIVGPTRVYPVVLLLLFFCDRGVAQDPLKGAAVIRRAAGPSEIVVRTTQRVAGAVHSLTWNAKEFINSVDHGRQLQSAANFDLGSKFTSETFNPTEAGSLADGAGKSSTSRLLHMVVGKDSLQTTTRMAFWLAPGETSAGNKAKNKQALSNHLVTKRVRLGYRNLSHVIQYDVTFGVPLDEKHNYAQFEAVTGYMPPEFSRFWKYNPQSTRLEHLSDGPGEQAYPVVFSTRNGSHAMGVFSPDQPSRGYEQAGYGRFRFASHKVVKWNCVFRLRGNNVRAGDYRFRMFVIVGDLKVVTHSMRMLHQEFHRRAKSR